MIAAPSDAKKFPPASRSVVATRLTAWPAPSRLHAAIVMNAWPVGPAADEDRVDVVAASHVAEVQYALQSRVLVAVVTEFFARSRCSAPRRQLRPSALREAPKPPCRRTWLPAPIVPWLCVVGGNFAWSGECRAAPGAESAWGGGGGGCSCMGIAARVRRRVLVVPGCGVRSRVIDASARIPHRVPHASPRSR